MRPSSGGGSARRLLIRGRQININQNSFFKERALANDEALCDSLRVIVTGNEKH
jgi:hypothetical protein